MTVVSVVGLALGTTGLYGDPADALGPTPATAGILVPAFLGHDVFDFFAGLPILLIAAWLACRGSQFALPLWPARVSIRCSTSHVPPTGMSSDS